VRPGIWFDKSFSLIVHANGQGCINGEHSWADAPIIGHLLEHVLVGEVKAQLYDDDGHVKLRDGRARCGSRLFGAAGVGAPSGRRPRGYSADALAHSHATTAASGPAELPLSPSAAATTMAGASNAGRWQRLSWVISAELEEAIFAARASLCALAEDLDLVVTSHAEYGKGFVKRCGVSPDAYLQMALQLAYFRDQRHFDNTYESSMTRLFADGRTETVRPVTAEATAFVLLMEQQGIGGGGVGGGGGGVGGGGGGVGVGGGGGAPSGAPTPASPLAKLAALRAACEKHVALYVAAMEGCGFDRHLFALYVVAVGTGTESAFLKQALGQPWRLSTSQVPQQQTSLWSIKDKRFASAISAGGGFSAVAADGYGVSYSVAGEDEFVFHVSACVKSAPKTSAARFTGHILQALADMRAVLSQALGSEAAASAAAHNEGGTGRSPSDPSSSSSSSSSSSLSKAPPKRARAQPPLPSADASTPALATPQPLMLSGATSS
jgi:carnitine O-palmitoyltransferase 1